MAGDPGQPSRLALRNENVRLAQAAPAPVEQVAAIAPQPAPQPVAAEVPEPIAQYIPPSAPVAEQVAQAEPVPAPGSEPQTAS
jgi:hypothetical protein